MPTIRIPSLDYTSRDQASIKSDMIRGIPFYTPEWTDHNNTDFGIVLLSLLAGQLDVLHFYVDRMAAESFITTAVKRESVIKLLRLVGYELRSPSPASVDVTFSLAKALNEDVVIPAGTRVQTVAAESTSPVIFETATAATIPALSLEVDASAVEGLSDEESLGVSNGNPIQEFSFLTANIIEASVKVYVDEGSGEVLWTKVTSFVDSLSTSTCYRTERDASGNLKVLFGDNLQGKIPPATSTVRGEFRYLVGDRGGQGVYGNVGAGTVKVVASEVFVGGKTVTLSVTNDLSASGGESEETTEEAKKQGPASVLTLGRAVTANDYKTLIERFGGVARSLVQQGSSGDACCACNLAVYVAPAGGGNPSTALKDSLLDYLNTVKMVGTCIEILDPTYVDVDISGTVYIFSNVDENSAVTNITDAVGEFFDLENANVDFGRDLYLGNIFAAIENVTGVDHVDLDKVTRVPVPNKVVWNGDNDIGPVTVGTGAQNEEWTITFLDDTNFSVVGDTSGIQSDGQIGALYTSDNGEISFTITIWVTLPSLPGDKITFSTSKLLGNVPISGAEIPQQGSLDLTFVVVAAAGSGNPCA